MAWGKICPLHKKPVDESNLCPLGHVVLQPVTGKVPDKPAPVAAAAPSGNGGISSPPPSGGGGSGHIGIAPKVTPFKDSPLAQPRRFVDPTNHYMTLRIKETTSNGWTIHCKHEEPVAKGKLKIIKQGTVRIYGKDLEKCKVEFADLCQSSLKGGWMDAPMRRVELMAIPEAKKR